MNFPGIAKHWVGQYLDFWVLAVAPEVQAALIYAVHPRIDRVAGSTLSELANHPRQLRVESVNEEVKP